MSANRLVGRAVEEFVASVASVDEPVPAGGSVAALTGAASAALLALACGVQRRKQSGVLAAELRQAERLQRELLALVDEDAAAFRAYLDAKRMSRQGERLDMRAALHRTRQTPFEIVAACSAVVELSVTVEAAVGGMLLGDILAARHLAGAALAAARAIAEVNAGLPNGKPSD